MDFTLTEAQEELAGLARRILADRVTPDGLIALHVSNKKLWLEPVVARIAEELGLAGRIWNDDGFRRPGKTASGWVVLARDEAALGTIAKPTDEQVVGFGGGNPELIRLLRTYGPDAGAARVVAREYGDLTPAEVGARHGGEASAVAEPVRPKDGGRPPRTLADLAVAVAGPMFRPLRVEAGVGVRRDGDKEWPAAVRVPEEK